MTSGKQKCPKCSAQMDEGFMLDNTHGGYEMPTFILGPLRKRWWGIQIKGQPKFSVVTYRCSRCGFLESYGLHERK